MVSLILAHLRVGLERAAALLLHELAPKPPGFGLDDAPDAVGGAARLAGSAKEPLAVLRGSKPAGPVG